MQVTTFSDYVLINPDDLNSIPLNFYGDFSDFFKQIASSSGTLENGVVGSTSFLCTASGGNLNITGGVCLAKFNNTPAPDFPTFAIASNINSATTVIPTGTGKLVASIQYDSTSANRDVYPPAALNPSQQSVTISRQLTITYSIITGTPTEYQIYLYDVDGNNPPVDKRNILFSGQDVSGDGQSIAVTNNIVSAFLKNGGGILKSTNGMYVDNAVILTTDTTNQSKTGNLIINGTLQTPTTPTNQYDVVNKKYSDTLFDSLPLFARSPNIAYFSNTLVSSNSTPCVPYDATSNRAFLGNAMIDLIDIYGSNTCTSSSIASIYDSFMLNTIGAYKISISSNYIQSFDQQGKYYFSTYTAGQGANDLAGLGNSLIVNEPSYCCGSFIINCDNINRRYGIAIAISNTVTSVSMQCERLQVLIEKLT